MEKFFILILVVSITVIAVDYLESQDVDKPQIEQSINEYECKQMIIEMWRNENE